MTPGLIVASHRETQTTSARDWLPEKNQTPASPPNRITRAKLLAERTIYFRNAGNVILLSSEWEQYAGDET